jgi:hypothetical protein
MAAAPRGTLLACTGKPERLEARTILGFRWWSSQELLNTTETIFPPQLGQLLTELLVEEVQDEG